MEPVCRGLIVIGYCITKSNRLSCLVGPVDWWWVSSKIGRDDTSGTVVVVLQAKCEVALVGNTASTYLKIIGAWCQGTEGCVQYPSGSVGTSSRYQVGAIGSCIQPNRWRLKTCDIDIQCWSGDVNSVPYISSWRWHVTRWLTAKQRSVRLLSSSA